MYLRYNYRKIVKDLVPTLNTLLVSRNQEISCVSSVLLEKIEKKIISELFDCENDDEQLKQLFDSTVILEDKSFLNDLVVYENKVENSIEVIDILEEKNAKQIRHRKLTQLNLDDICKLFDGFTPNKIEYEDLIDCQFCKDFFNEVYNKYNKLDIKIGRKRKKICRKLLKILKIIVYHANLDSFN